MVTRVSVDVPSASYDVVIGRGLLAQIGSLVRDCSTSQRAALITDASVAPLYGAQVDSALARSGFNVTAMTLPAGEASKNWKLAGEVVEALAAAKLGRQDVLVALGGGVVGDLAGFCSAVYLRGIGFVQVPTTLLAMVDSSVGGKTAVDLAAGKNLAGAFKQPLLVVADVASLDSLPLEQWRSGLAEAVKSAVLEGEEFTRWFEERTLLGEGPSDDVEELVRRCVAFKAQVVECDEREEGPRESLNYGHTLGHAIEKVAGYGTFTHGAAVAEGMRFAARIAADVGMADMGFVRRQDRLLDALGLTPLRVELSVDDLLSAMHSDKKARGGVVRMVLVDSPGVWSCAPVDDAVVRAHLEQWVSTKGRSQA